MITIKNISSILNQSKLIKNDHTKVYNYQNEYIIKENSFDQDIISHLQNEKIFLDYMLEKWVKINNLLTFFEFENKIYSIYKYENETENTYDYEKIWENIKRMHELSREKTFGFNDFKLRNINFSSLIPLFWEDFYKKWLNISQNIILEYENYIKTEKFDTIIHYDIILQNIIKPYTLIDTEQLAKWLIYHDIGSIMRLWYRNHDYKIMNDILSGYWLSNITEKHFIFMHLKDMTNIKWLLSNHRNDKIRIDQIKWRIDNFFDFKFKWIVF